MKKVFESYLLEHFDATKEDVKEFELSLLALAISNVIVLDLIFKFIRWGGNMTVDEYRYLKEDLNTSNLSEREEKENATRATWAVAEACFKAIDDLSVDEKEALSSDYDDLLDMILGKLGE